MIKTKFLILGLLVLFVNSAFSQDKSTIKFYEDTPWNEIVDIAEKAGKQVYVYTYTLH